MFAADLTGSVWALLRKVTRCPEQAKQVQCRGDGAALAGCRSPCWGFSQQPSKARVEEKDKKGYLEFRKTFRNKLFYNI